MPRTRGSAGTATCTRGRCPPCSGMAGIPAIAETTVVARDLDLAALTGASYHAQHVSCAQTVELIRAAKERGVAVTAEVTPHHLWFSERHVLSMDPVFKMYPPLRTPSDIEALADGLREGAIDAVATDHAPHAAHEKDVPFEEAPKGVIGLETAFAAVRSALDPDPRLLFRRMSVAPAAIASLERHGRWIEPGIPANLVVVDWEEGVGTTALRVEVGQFAVRRGAAHREGLLHVLRGPVTHDGGARAAGLAHRVGTVAMTGGAP